MAMAFARLFGNVPSGPLFGYFISSSCIVRKTVCKKDSKCTMMDGDQPLIKVLVASYVASAIGCIGLLVAMLKYKKPKGTLSLTYSRTRSRGTLSDDTRAAVKTEEYDDRRLPATP